MHHCLKIQEILSIVFTLLHQEWVCGRGHRMLARLAMTCKAFHDPAINVLWYHQSSLYHLIRCLPSDAHTTVPGHSHILKLARDLRPTDWERLEYYAHRIKVLGPDDGSRGLDSQVIPIIWSRRPNPDRPLLSSVREFNLTMSDFAGLALYPRLIAGSALTSVDIKLTVNDSATRESRFSNVLSILQKLSPAITTFTFCAIPRDLDAIYLDTESADLMRLVRCFQDIESLYLWSIPITNNTFAHLATLPKLRELIIRNDDSDIALFLTNVPSTVSCFQNLRELKMEAQSLDLCSKVIECRGLQRLESLSIGWANRHISWDLNSFFQTLRDHCSHPNLKSIALYGSKFNSGWPEVSIMPVVTSRSLLPLLSFTNMVSFQMDLDNRFDLDDQTLKSISEAWPQLRILNLRERSSGRSTKVTLQGLVPLIANCPELYELCLLVDTVNLPIFSELGDIIPGNKLCYLDVCTSLLEEDDIYAVVEFIIVAFPSIQYMFHGWEPVGTHNVPLLELSKEQLLFRSSWDDVITGLRPILADRKGSYQYMEF